MFQGNSIGIMDDPLNLFLQRNARAAWETWENFLVGNNAAAAADYRSWSLEPGIRQILVQALPVLLTDLPSLHQFSCLKMGNAHVWLTREGIQHSNLEHRQGSMMVA